MNSATVGVQKPAWQAPEGTWTGKVTFDAGVLEADPSGLWEVVDH
jgi:hypothetical protein